MKLFIPFLLALLVLSCASETEQKSLNQIAEIYKAKTAYSKGFNSNVGEKTIRNFKITASESKLLDSLRPELSSSNIALLVYEGFTSEEKETYDEIKVDILNLKKDTASFVFQLPVLEKLSKKSTAFKQFSENILLRKYNLLDSIKNAADFKTPISKSIEDLMQKNEAVFGELITYCPISLAETEDEISGIYQYRGLFIYKNDAIPYLVAVDATEGKDKMIGYKINK
ncbi:hypothetical protein [Ulvibacter litoralis]|uniref:Lipoprotein n=1 Tax=Ulvibacter litoralis TaxID=227084 RepID=A0A1G7BVB9_9FLAO|nr:hypothetical protein [Ulvibacter litoralis]GHC49598.1 hypothetical protein GCM10008083_11450 [Ulvibacter litoralis]SDE31084.1 hypothetical protein SAMN05421855_10141 [Ulvibacter litoralis]